MFYMQRIYIGNIIWYIL